MKKNIFILLQIIAFNVSAQKINVVGAMKNVMWKGELKGTIWLDSIANKTNLCALGPLENLKGEITVIDGVAYKATVVNDTIVVEKSFDIKAPFLGYTNINVWKVLKTNKKISSLKELEVFLNSKKFAEPFFFKIECEVETAKYHIMDLPDGTIVTSPDVAHSLGQKHFEIINEKVTILGFYSTTHQTILTHHDTNMHLHILNEAKTKMGHLEEIKIVPNTIKIYTSL